MRVYLIGIGMGNPDTLTVGGLRAIRQSQLLVGARRMLDAVAPVAPSQPAPRMVEAVRADDVEAALRQSDAGVASVLFSGDLGLYSGFSQVRGRLAGMDVEVVPGVSSLSYLCAKLGAPWQDAHIVSVHGCEANVVGAVQSHAKTFILTGGATKAQDVCADLAAHDLAAVQIAAGERLSYPDERIVRGSAGDLQNEAFCDLTVLLATNAAPIERQTSVPCLPDAAFARNESTPMTKEEVRELAVCKLRLRPDDVVWDVGAGTGSVSVEAALAVPRGQVVAVEKDRAALDVLAYNKSIRNLTNLRIVDGRAPKALLGLPAPDRVFVGGSAGGMEGILRAAVKANPSLRVVITCITLETVGAALAALDACGFRHPEVVQVAVARAQEAGPYHLMMGQNPVYLFCAGGEEA